MSYNIFRRIMTASLILMIIGIIFGTYKIGFEMGILEEQERSEFMEKYFDVYFLKKDFNCIEEKDYYICSRYR